MHRFYYPDKLSDNNKIILQQKEECHHLKNVLRLQKDDVIILFNSYAQEVRGIITSIGAHQIEINPQEFQQFEIPKPQITLACAIPKKGKFEWIIEKATELNVTEIIPLQTHRTEVIIDDKKALKKKERFQNVAMNAAKQCKRVTIPHIHKTLSLNAALEKCKGSSEMFIPSLQNPTQTLIEALSNNKNTHAISFFIGPEGDFTDEEYDLAKNQGVHPVSLGCNTLKVETAAISAMACAHCFYKQ